MLRFIDSGTAYRVGSAKSFIVDRKHQVLVRGNLEKQKNELKLSQQHAKFITLQVFLVSIILTRAQSGESLPKPERSIDDSDFAKTANYIMKTAMKLPPHILPTLEELDTKDRKRVIQNQVRSLEGRL